MLDTQIITIDFNTYRIKYQSTKIGDEVVVKSTKPYIYEATIADADDMNWIIIKTLQRVWLLIIKNVKSVFFNTPLINIKAGLSL